MVPDIISHSIHPPYDKAQIRQTGPPLPRSLLIPPGDDARRGDRGSPPPGHQHLGMKRDWVKKGQNNLHEFRAYFKSVFAPPPDDVCVAPGGSPGCV